jgi:glutamine amidotransferase
MGWNDVFVKERSVIFNGLKNPIFYFVHSYEFIPEKNFVISAEVEYGKKFVAAVEYNNIFGLQFHAEKSQYEGLKVLENFLSYSK